MKRRMFSIPRRSMRMSGRITTPVLLFFAIFMLAGCAGVSRTAVFPPERSDLQAIAEKADGRTFEVLGVVQVDGRNFTAETTLIGKVKEKARELGADDVLNLKVMSLPRGNGFMNGLVRYHLSTAEGIAVRWKSSSVQQARVLPEDGSEVPQ
jgi:hypothetical protein